MSQIAFDFDSILGRMKQNLSKKSLWADFLSFGVAENILAPIAQELAYSMGYDEYLTVENMWAKARNKSSLLVQSPVHGYRVPRKISARGTLRVSTSKDFDAPYAGGMNVPIPKFFEFSGNGIYVVSDLNYTLLATSPYIDIECRQGEYKSVVFLALGELWETKEISDDSVDNDFFELYVNGIKWECVDTLFEYNAEDLVYEVYTKNDLSGVILKFGNGVFGRKLEVNDRVEFRYISTKGEQGIIYAPSIIDTVESQAFDVNGKPVKLFVTNISAIIGGKDYPSLDNIRTLSPRVYQTGDRASSSADYQTKLEQFSYISKVNVWGAFETLKDENRDLWDFIPSDENVVHLALLDTLYQNLSDEEKTQVITDLHAKCDPTDLIHFEDVEKIPLIFNVNAVVKNSSYSLVQVKSNIETALVDNYSIEHMDFNENIYNSDFVAMLDAVDGVRNHISTILCKKEGNLFIQTYLAKLELPVYPLDYTKFAIYIMDTTEEEPVYELLALCDANGSIIGQNGYNTSNSVINLNTGLGVLIVNNKLTKNYTRYKLKVIYGSLSPDMILKNRADIFTYDSANITVNYPSN